MDGVTVAGSGDHGKPRPAVSLKTDALPAEQASVVICQMTSDCDNVTLAFVMGPANR